MALTAARLIAYIGGDSSGATTEMNKVDAGLKNLGRQFAAFTGITIGAATVGRLTKDVLEAGIAFNSLQEQSTIAFTTMLGGGREATQFLEELQEFATFTPFEYADLIEQSKRLKAFGFEASQVVPMLTSVGDAVAGLGGGADKINRVTLALGQMQAKGVLSSQEMMQLTEAGIPAWQYLADTLNTDVAGAMKRVEQRTVDAGVAIEGILAGMDTDFGGMMEAQAQTMEGAWSTIKDTGAQIAGELTEPIFDALRDEMYKLATELPNILAAIKDRKSGEEAYRSGEEIPTGGWREFGKQDTEDLPGILRTVREGGGGEEELYRRRGMQAVDEYEAERVAALQAQIEELKTYIEAEQDLIAYIQSQAGEVIGGSEMIQQSEEDIAHYQDQIVGLSDELGQVKQIAKETREELGLDTGLPLAMKTGDIVEPMTEGEKATRAMANAAVDAKMNVEALTKATQELNMAWWSPELRAAAERDWSFVNWEAMDPVLEFTRGKDLADQLSEYRVEENEKANKRISDDYERELQRAIEAAHRKAERAVESILFTPSTVTQEDMFRSTDVGAGLFGGYENKPDEYVRRLEAAAQDANSEWRKLLIPEDVLAAGDEAIRIYVDRQKALFYSGMLPDEVNWDAFASQFQQQAEAEASRAALVDRGLVELQARGIEVSAEDVQAMIEPATGAGKQFSEQFTKAVADKSPVQLLLDQMNTEMAEKATAIRESGAAFFAAWFGGIADSKGTWLTLLLSALMPEIIAELDYAGYVGGENP